MDSIKIVDKLTLRQAALKMAIMQANDVDTSSSICAKAQSFENYILGNADLPEYVDPQSERKYFADLLGKMQENFKSNPWISVDSEMKPAQDSLVVGHSPNGRTDVLRYHDEVFIDELNQEHCINGWIPIPPFVEPLKL